MVLQRLRCDRPAADPRAASCPAATVADLEQTLKAAGFRGDHAPERLHRRQGARCSSACRCWPAAAFRLVEVGDADLAAWAAGRRHRRPAGCPTSSPGGCASATCGSSSAACPMRSTSWSSAPRRASRWRRTVERVATEIRPAHPAVAAEFAALLQRAAHPARPPCGADQHGGAHPAGGAAPSRHDPGADPAVRHAADPGAADALRPRCGTSSWCGSRPGRPGCRCC